MSDSIGFPQLNASSYPSQLFWLGVAFVVLYALMSRLALPRVTEVLEKRNAQKTGDLDKARQMNEEAEKVKITYKKSLAKAQKDASEVVTAAEQAISEKLAEAQSRFAENSRKRLVVIEQNIAKAKAEALHSLADISADIAADMVHKIADIQVNKADAKRVVTSVLQEG
ncbi:MAG: ATPase [Proteobacteria bacterium]|nr:ATPase [Pseudomonadota bacterium]